MSEGDVYDVEEIRGDRMYRGKRQFFIKWVGYDSSENTWEDEANLFCEDLLAAYKEKKARNAKPRGRPPTQKIAPPPITNDLAPLIKAVTAVRRANGALFATCQMVKGELQCMPVKELHTRAPIKLIEFYESNIIFKDRS